MTTSLITRSTCRICDSPLVPVLDLGHQHIAGAFADPIQRKVPLELMRCDTSHQGACGLVQLRHTVPGSVLYSSYWYRSGVNRTMTENLHEIARAAEQMLRAPDSELVVDIGCNDGTLLDGYSPGLRRVGFEPSDMADHAAEKGHTIIRDYFSTAMLRRKTGVHQARIITSIAMFYDLEDPAAFVADIADALHPTGVWAMELHYLPAMLDANSFDAIVHEHLTYYSLAVIERLLADAGLEVIVAQENAINGGSIRLFIGHHGAHREYQPTGEQNAELRRLRVAEFEAALDTAWPYERFAGRVSQARDQLRAVCQDAHGASDRIHVYGASTKGNTILQYAGLGPDLIEAAADRNPAKYGTRTATGIPIISEAESRRSEPDYYLVLPWHFLDEFVEREQAFLENGGRFIVPLPEVRIVGRERQPA